MADVKPFDAVLLIIALTDVIIKVTVADFIATFFWQMLLPLMCGLVLLPTILICFFFMLTIWQLLLPAIFIVVDVKTTCWTSIYNG